MADQPTPRPGLASGTGIYAFRLWGRFSAKRIADGVDVTPRGRKTRGLLAYLLLENGPAAREHLAGLLWSERGQAQARASLRQCLLELRDYALLLEIDRHQVRLSPGCARTDLDEAFRASGQGDADAVAAALPTGAALLEDLDGLDPAFDQWLRTTRAERGRALLAAARAAGEAAIKAGKTEAAERLVRKLQAIDPLDEGTARLAMEAGHRAGRQETVQRVYDRLAADLKEELDVTPSATTRALREQLIGSAAAPVAEAKASKAGEAEADSVSSVDPRPRPPWWRRRWTIAAAAVLILLAAAGALLGPVLLDRTGAGAEPVSIAVLPFRNLSAGDDHFAEGVGEEILAQLAREPQMRVAGRTSSSLFRDAANVRDVGRRLNVAYVLEGSVRRAGDRVHVDVALVGTRDGMRLWSQAFQGRLDDIFAIQRNIGSEVTRALRLRFAQAAPPSRAMRTSGEVHALYLTARGLVRTRDPQNIGTAIRLLRRAVRLDPNYAPAWSSLGAAVWQHWTTGELADGRQEVERALSLAPDLAEAHAAMGLIETSSERARRHLERAVQLDPNNAEAWLWLSTARGRTNDFEGGLAALRRVTELDPFWLRANQFGDVAWAMGYRDEALRFERQLIARHPEESHRELARARIALRQGDWSGYVLRQWRSAELDADYRFEARWHANWILIALGLPFAENMVMTPFSPFWVKLMKGELPPLSEFRMRFDRPERFWQAQGINHSAARLFLNQRRSHEYLLLYDRAFASPNDFAVSDADTDFLFHAPLLAIALRDAGRGPEAQRLLVLANRRVTAAAGRGRPPADALWRAARVWAVEGRRGAALAALERAAALGWPLAFNPYPSLLQPAYSDDPAFGSLRDDQRFQRLDAGIRAHLARERRELRAAVAQGPRP